MLYYTHVAGDDVIEGQRVNSGVRLHAKPARLPAKSERKELHLFSFEKKGGFLTQVLVDIKYYLYLVIYILYLLTIIIFSILKL